MGTLAISVFFFFAILMYWRRKHQQYAEEKFRYKLFSIRDKLRLEAIKGNIDHKSWVFKHYDRSLSKSINESYYLTIFNISLLWLKHNADEEVSKHSKRVEIETKKNTILKDVREDYFIALKTYMISQHYVSIKFFWKPLLSAIIGTKNLVKVYQKSIANTLSYPETSAAV